MTFVGVDGCKIGWFTVALKEGYSYKIDVFPDIEELWNKYKGASLILIDIPIGLKEEGNQQRLCDIEARNKLVPRKSAVFPVPCRAAVYAKNYTEANSINKKITGRGLSPMSWAIVPKIREVDEFLNNKHIGLHIREVHPELCFCKLAGCKPMEYNKKEPKGFSDRKNVLQPLYHKTDELIETALENYKRKEVVKDDILDALAAAVTALLGGRKGKKLASIPKTPEFDSKGLRMEMVYYKVK